MSLLSREGGAPTARGLPRLRCGADAARPPTRAGARPSPVWASRASWHLEGVARCPLRRLRDGDTRRGGVRILTCADMAAHPGVRPSWCAQSVRSFATIAAWMCTRAQATWRSGSRLAQPLSGDVRARTRSDSHVPALSNIHELGDICSPCSPPCPPPGTCPERLHGGRQLVPRRVQVACTIASMGQTGAGTSGLTRTCTVVANCHHRATCGFAPTCRAVRTAPSPASGLIRTPAVVPIWHHRVTWGSTKPPTRHWPVPARRTNRATMVLPNWQNHMTWADAPGPSTGLLSPGVDVGADHQPPHPDGRHPIRVAESDPHHALDRPRDTNRTSTVPPIWRDRTNCANAPVPGTTHQRLVKSPVVV